jgi:hypothetical protein
VPQPLSAKTAVARAVKRNPATITKRSRGQASAKFQAWTVSQLLETYQDPRATLLEIASMPVDKLQALAKCTALEAMQEKRLAAGLALPYLCQKLPVLVDMRSTKTIHLNIVDERQFLELQQIAGGDAMAMQLVTGAVTESVIEASNVEDGESQTHVLPAVAAPPPGGRDPGKQGG